MSGQRDYPLKCLATRIMYGQIKLLARRDPDYAIRLAHDFFLRNETLAAEDLRTVFYGGVHE